MRGIVISQRCSGPRQRMQLGTRLEGLEPRDAYLDHFCCYIRRRPRYCRCRCPGADPVGATGAAEVWSETEVDYKTRDDLIPNLEETLKMYGFPQREGSEAQAAWAAPSPQRLAGPDPTGRQGDPERASRRDNLAEAS